MVTSLLSSLHHATCAGIAALILNLDARGTELLTSRLGRLTLGQNPDAYLVLPPSCRLSFCNFNIWKWFQFPRYLLPLRIPVSAGEYCSHLTSSRVSHVVITECRKIKLKASGWSMVITVIPGFVKTSQMVKMYKLKQQTDKKGHTSTLAILNFVFCNRFFSK